MTPPERSILFVCTGNTCRSPMSEALARHLLAQNPDHDSHTTVHSAGVSTIDGLPVSPEAVTVMQARGLDLTAHRSTLITPELIARATVVLTMTQVHAEAVTRLVPGAAHKVALLDPDGPVPDPYGQPVEEYEQTAARLEQLIRTRLTELDA